MKLPKGSTKKPKLLTKAEKLAVSAKRKTTKKYHTKVLAMRKKRRKVLNKVLNASTPPEQPKKETVKRHKVYKKTAAAIAMMDSGMDAKTALQVVNNTPRPAKATIYSLQAKHRDHTLTAPSTVKLAESQLKRILRAKAKREDHTKVMGNGEVVVYTDNIYPTDTNIIAAAGMVYDRYEPAVKMQASLNMAVDVVDLSTFRNIMPVST